MARVFLIGHRGVGKTSLVKALESSLDLDEEISKTSDIASFFSQGKEREFRDLELQTLKALSPSVHVISLGAGFDLDSYPFSSEDRLIWIQRKSDVQGRVFFDRPRLEQNLSPLEEFYKRFTVREEAYERHAHFKVEVEEGRPKSVLPELKKIIQGSPLSCFPGYFTLENLKQKDFIEAPIEWRTDLIHEEVIREGLRTQDLVALRTKVSSEFLEFLASRLVQVDFPWEDYKDVEIPLKDYFFSSHESLPFDEIETILNRGVHLKWAPEILNLKQLKETHEQVIDWVEEGKLSFLPRSSSGRWSWYRQMHHFKNKISFYRFGRTAHLDQPLYYELETGVKTKDAVSGAVLGEEIELSWSPAFHRSFFYENYQGTYYKIPLTREEGTLKNIEWLKEQGIKCFSLTSPFKKLVPHLNLESVNTLAYTKEEFKTKNTDLFSIKDLVQSLKAHKRVLVWGTGAMGKALERQNSQKFKAFSVQSQQQKPILEEYSACVWAAGLEAPLPQLEKSPQEVFDLDYKENSRGREAALFWGANYTSGKRFFDIQAREQQSFWKEQEF